MNVFTNFVNISINYHDFDLENEHRCNSAEALNSLLIKIGIYRKKLNVLHSL